ncbi:EVE domain-containing protein, partial [uncultured Meiothermus sp.]|uniref:EVE domain-containing protein n=1 Tax=uncultured Meiothermus sp. TaxID=157471 RepID=UPI00261D95DE
MAYFLNLFSPETYEAFTESSQTVSGFRPRQRNAVGRIQIGDKLICYMTKLSRWVGLFEVLSEHFIDNTPIFQTENDPFVIRFKVRPLIWLPKEHGVPIHEDDIWKGLSFTKDLDKNSITWTGKVRSSLCYTNPCSSPP